MFSITSMPLENRSLIMACATGAIWVAAPLALLLPAIPTYLTVGALASLWLPMWNTPITTLRQTVTAPRLLGRVHATARTINFCTIPLGAVVGWAGAEFLTSTLGAANGLSVTLVVVGLLAGSGAAVVLVWSPVRALAATGSVPAAGDELRDGPANDQEDHGDREESTDGSHQLH
jgi:hypothetical protein